MENTNKYTFLSSILEIFNIFLLLNFLSPIWEKEK